MENSNINLVNICNDVLKIILLYLNFIDLVFLSQVCKKFNLLIKNSNFRPRVSIDMGNLFSYIANASMLPVNTINAPQFNYSIINSQVITNNALNILIINAFRSIITNTPKKIFRSLMLVFLQIIDKLSDENICELFRDFSIKINTENISIQFKITNITFKIYISTFYVYVVYIEAGYKNESRNHRGVVREVKYEEYYDNNPELYNNSIFRNNKLDHKKREILDQVMLAIFNVYFNK